MSAQKDVYDVCIVGGGISGLTSAHELSPHSKVAVIERNSTLGGVARSWKTKENVFIEHSWRGFPIVYKNVRSILSQIPYGNKQSNPNDLSLVNTQSNSKWEYITDANIFDKWEHRNTNLVDERNHDSKTCLSNLTYNDIFFNYKFLFEKNNNTNYYTWSDSLVVLFFSFIHILTRGTYTSSLTLKDVLSRNFYNLIGYTGLGLDPSISSVTDLVRCLFLLQFNHFQPPQRIHVEPSGNIKSDLLINFEYDNVEWNVKPASGEYTIVQKHNNRYYISDEVFFELRTNTISYQAFTKSTQEGWFTPWKKKLENDGVVFYMDTAVVSMSPEGGGGYSLVLERGETRHTILCKKVIIACGFQSIHSLFDTKNTNTNTHATHARHLHETTDKNTHEEKIVDTKLYERLNISVSTTCLVETCSPIKEPYSVFLDSPISFSYQIINHIFEDSTEVPVDKCKFIFNIHCLVNKEPSLLFPNKTTSQLTEDEFKEEMKYYLFLLCNKNGIEIRKIVYISVSEDVVFDGIEAHTKYDNGFFITKGDNLIKKQYEYLPDVYFAGHDVENSIDIRTMESACETGKVAAKKCLDDLQIKHGVVVYTMTKVENWFDTLSQNPVCMIFMVTAFIYILIRLKRVKTWRVGIAVLVIYTISVYVTVCICQLFSFAKGLYDIYGKEGETEKEKYI